MGAAGGGSTRGAGRGLRRASRGPPAAPQPVLSQEPSSSLPMTTVSHPACVTSRPAGHGLQPAAGHVPAPPTGQPPPATPTRRQPTHPYPARSAEPPHYPRGVVSRPVVMRAALGAVTALAGGIPHRSGGDRGRAPAERWRPRPTPCPRRTTLRCWSRSTSSPRARCRTAGRSSCPGRWSTATWRPGPGSASTRSSTPGPTAPGLSPADHDRQRGWSRRRRPIPRTWSAPGSPMSVTSIDELAPGEVQDLLDPGPARPAAGHDARRVLVRRPRPRGQREHPGRLVADGRARTFLPYVPRGPGRDPGQGRRRDRGAAPLPDPPPRQRAARPARGVGDGLRR